MVFCAVAGTAFWIMSFIVCLCCGMGPGIVVVCSGGLFSL